MVIASGKFTGVEREIALELVDVALVDGDASGYTIALLAFGKEQSNLYAYTRYGPTPLT